ncbi:MAG: hypothetical protein BroJett004_22610 [Planctomycetota bacterium]|nr:MAG: hypothetical protein BroJett004_22610 [Planctomycetota bacterium]
MNASAIVDRLEAFGRALPGVAACVREADARWKPASGAWSVLEVVNHLADEEADDFRARVRFVLERRDGPWPPIDPEGWARERRYNERGLRESVERFVREREASVAWLRQVVAAGADWSLAYQHPKFGPIRAGDLLGAWGAHDALHLRQIAKRMFELAGRDAAGFITLYAGEWGA